MIPARRPRRGAVLALIAMILPPLLLAMAYCIHVAYVESINSRVQTTTDLVARSAGQQYARTGNRDWALWAANGAAQRNPVAGVTVPFEMDDLRFGISERYSLGDEYTFTTLEPDDPRVGNAVKVRTGTLAAATTPLIPPVFPTFGLPMEIRPQRVATNTQGTLDIAVVLDRSGSMRFAADEIAGVAYQPVAQPPGWYYGDRLDFPSRWRDTVAAFAAFVDHLESTPRREKLSLSSFAEDSSTESPLTADMDAMRVALDQLSDDYQGGATALGTGMAEGLAALMDSDRNRPWATRVLVVMTDGKHDGIGVDPTDVASLIQELGVTLFTVTFSDEADEDRMRDLADACGGQHFHAEAGWELWWMFQQIARQLPSLLTK